MTDLTTAERWQAVERARASQRHGKRVKNNPTNSINQDVRHMVERAGVFYFEIAAYMGIRPETLCRKMAKPLKDTDRAQILAAVEGLTKGPQV